MNVFAPFYELFGLAYMESFSDDLFTNNIYSPIGITMVIINIVFMLLYYYLLSNYRTFYKTKFWFLWLLLTAVLNFGIAVFLADNLLYMAYDGDYQEGYVSSIYILSLINFMWSIILGILLSLLLKLKSIKASRTPF